MHYGKEIVSGYGFYQAHVCDQGRAFPPPPKAVGAERRTQKWTVAKPSANLAAMTATGHNHVSCKYHYTKREGMICLSVE